MHLRPQHNFRDLGGHRTADGATIRTGAVYRSAHLHEADDDDLEALARLGIRTICDLRTLDEAAARPSALAALPGVEVVRLGQVGARVIGDPVTAIIEYGFTQVTEHDVARFYEFLVEEQPRVFGQVVEVCAEAPRHAVVVHCSAGKDRTGIAAALLLSALGVPDDAVISDYALTSEYWSPSQLRRAQPLLEEAGLSFESLRTYFLAPAEAMTRTLDHLRSRHGSIEDYLTGAAGVSRRALANLRTALTDGNGARSG